MKAALFAFACGAVAGWLVHQCPTDTTPWEHDPVVPQQQQQPVKPPGKIIQLSMPCTWISQRWGGEPLTECVNADLRR